MTNTDFTNAAPVPGTAGQPDKAGGDGFTVIAGGPKPEPSASPAAPSPATSVPSPSPQAPTPSPAASPSPQSVQLDLSGAPTGEAGFISTTKPAKFNDFAIQARQAGYSWDDINKYADQKIQASRAANYSDPEIAGYLGWDPNQVASFESMLNTHAATTFGGLQADPAKQNPDGSNDSLWDAFWTAATHGSIPSGVRMLTNTVDQQSVAKQYPDIFRQTAQMLGYTVGGMGEAAVVGGAVGAAGGSVVPGVGTGVGALVGAAVGVGAAIIGDGATRDVAASYITQGAPKSVTDFGQRYIQAAINNAPSGVVAAAATLTGGIVNPIVARAALGPVLGWGTRAAAQVATLTAVSAGINGHMPTVQDAVDAGISVAAFELAGKVGRVGLVVAGKAASKAAAAAKPSTDDVGKAMAAVMASYVRTGELPKDVPARIVRDTSFDGLVQREEKANGPIPTSKPDDVLANKDVQAGLAAPRNIVRATVPDGAGSSNDGKTTYISDKIPQALNVETLDGKSVVIDPTKYLNIHEQVEHTVSAVGGADQSDAHYNHAQPAEHAALRADNIDPKSYETALKPYLDEAGKTSLDDAPKDLYEKPYDHPEIYANGPPEPTDSPATMSELRGEWDRQNLDDYSPLIRARWFASALDDGVQVANDLLKASGGIPARFNELRGAYLLPQYTENPKQFGGTLDKYMTRLDSRPPPSPEARIQTAKDGQNPGGIIKQIGDPTITTRYMRGLEDGLNRDTTQAIARRIRAKQLVDIVAPKLKAPPADGSYPTLNAKFAAYTRGETDLTPQEEAIYNETAAPLVQLHSDLVKTLKDWAKTQGDITGRGNPIPFLSSKAMADLGFVSGDNFLGDILNKVVRLQDIAGYKARVEALKSDPTFQANSVQEKDFDAEAGNPPPKGYVKINAPGYEGLLADAKIADPINDFMAKAPTGNKLFEWANKANELAIGALFMLPDGAIAHSFKNIAIGTWLPARGFDNFRLPKFGRALQAVNTLSPEYLEVLDHGGSLISSRIGDNSITAFTMKSLGQSIAKDPKRWGPVAKALGLNNFNDMASGYSTWMSKEMFRTQDYLYMQRYFELKDKGYTTDQAIHEVELFMPTYRADSRLFGARFPNAGRFASNVLSNNNFAAFGRYEISKYTAVANGIRTLIDPKASYEGRVMAAGRLFFATLMMTAGQAMMDSMVQHLTGNPDANWLFGGPLGLAQKGIKFALSPNQDTWSSLAATAFTPAIGTWEILQQLTNVNAFNPFNANNKVTPIATAGAPSAQKWLERANHAAAGFNLSKPASALGNLPKYFSDPKLAAQDLAGYAGQAMGLSNPSPAAVATRARIQSGNISKTEARSVRASRAKLPGFEQGFLDSVGD